VVYALTSLFAITITSSWLLEMVWGTTRSSLPSANGEGHTTMGADTLKVLPVLVGAGSLQ
jgi:hypothetical protein